jgi:hypothetical protein
MTFQKVVWSNKSYNHDTPDEVFSDLHKEFNFTLDPTDKPIIGSGLVNGLKDAWGSLKKPNRIYLNPPYARNLTKRWIFKAWQQLCIGNIEIAVMLLPASMGTDWAIFLLQHGAEFRVNRGRLKFGDAELGAPFWSMIAILTKQNLIKY